MQIKKETILRTVILLFTLINSVLVMTGKNPLPFSEDQVYADFSAFLSVGVSLWSWWKNNSFTKPALLADEYLKEIKRGI